jgi:ammonium transporter, Amt family
MSPEELKVAADTMWVLIAGFLVFFMHAGFALLESGLCRAKNAANILGKNLMVVALSSIAFWIIGFGLMFGDGNSILGLNGFLLGGLDNSPATGDAYMGVFSALNWTSVPLMAKFFFQLVFAATAATIVSGAVAERIHLPAFLVFSFVLVAVMYPISGHWIWGGGFLAGLGFWDFAGSTVVHSVGGWAALAGVMVLGARLGKYRKDGIHAIPGHNMSTATLGGLILWLGWFGFNPGSTMAAVPGDIAHIAVTTNMAAAAGAITAILTAWAVIGKPDLSMIINGALAGLVAITAPCAFVTLSSSVIIGAVAGVLVVFSVLFFDKIKIDDPVGAISVHLVNGIWGTLALGLFAQDIVASGTTGDGLLFGGGTGLLWAQLQGIFWVGLFIFPTSLVLWYIVKMVLGLRVAPHVEIEGLDIHEMGMEAYGKDTFGTEYLTEVIEA